MKGLTAAEETLPQPRLTGEYILDSILIENFKQRKPIRVIQRKPFKKQFVGELLYDSILQDYYNDLEMTEKEDKPTESQVGLLSQKAVPKDTSTKTAYSSNKIELLILLSDDIDVERKRSKKTGYYFVFSRYQYANEVRTVNVSYRYLQQMSDMRQQITGALEDKIEREFPVQRCNHGIVIKQFMEFWYVTIPYYNPDKTTDFYKSLNLSVPEWLNLVDCFPMLLKGDNEGYMTKRRSRSVPADVRVIDKRQRRNSSPPDGADTHPGTSTQYTENPTGGGAGVTSE